MATIRLHQDFKDFLKLLNFHKVEYLVIGGYAVGYHGYILELPVTSIFGLPTMLTMQKK